MERAVIWGRMTWPSEAGALNAAMHGEEIDHHAGQDHQKHHGGNSGTHGGIADLQLIAEEGAIEQGPHDVGGKIRPGKGTLDRIDQIKSVEVVDKDQDR